MSRNNNNNNKPFADLTREEINRLSSQEKKGNIEEKVDAAHILSIELSQFVMESKPGPKVTDFESLQATAEVINSSVNLRMKSQEGNRSTDRNNDAKIMEKIASNTPLSTKAEADRVKQAFTIARDNSGIFLSCCEKTSSIQQTCPVTWHSWPTNLGIFPFTLVALVVPR